VLDGWFARALAPQLERRFASAQELAAAFAAAAAETDRLGFGARDLSDLPVPPGPVSVRVGGVVVAGPDPHAEREGLGPDGQSVSDDGALAATVAVPGLGERLFDASTLERPSAPPEPVAESQTAERTLPRPSAPRPRASSPGSIPPPPSAVPSAPGPRPSSPGSIPPPSAPPSARGSLPSVPPSVPASVAGNGAGARSPATGHRSSRGTWLAVLGAAVAVAVGGSAALLGSSRDRALGRATTAGSADGRASARTSSDSAAGEATGTTGSAAVGSGASDAASGRVGAESTKPHGSLSLVCEPRCEQVLVDDWTRGPSPLNGLELDPGEHRVTLKRGDRPPKVIRVTIVAGEETRRVVPMSAPPDAGATASAAASATAPGSGGPLPGGSASGAP
jgi:hypothetical protein